MNFMEVLVSMIWKCVMIQIVELKTMKRIMNALRIVMNSGDSSFRVLGNNYSGSLSELGKITKMVI